ncbi:MAG TPA: bifunctional nuclease family protein [Anaerolineae bacterium]|nr:bifunctional nuclease family protein [Anaerolineae bacterium]
MTEMIKVQIDSVRVHLMTPQRLVVLKQLESERYLPIWVGPYEAEAITVALQEVEMSRPLTHDLLKNVFGAFNAHITRIEIVKLQNDIFYGSIVAEVNGKEVHVDSRPSDAIALSVRAHVPILVHQSVMDEAGIMPEEDISGSGESLEKSPPAPLSMEGAARLSVFEDFLGKLDLDNLDDKDKPGGKDKPDDEPPADKPDKPKKPKKK